MKHTIKRESDVVSVKAEMKKRSRQFTKKCRMEKTLIKHGDWINMY